METIMQFLKEALFHSFSAISSSSVTTIVGLLALVFMSFTIGKDLGLVLAKLFTTIFHHQVKFNSEISGVKAENAVSALIYEKVTKC